MRPAKREFDMPAAEQRSPVRWAVPSFPVQGLGVARSMGPNRIGVSPENGRRVRSRELVASCLGYLTMAEVQRSRSNTDVTHYS